ncbi:hypothetical protein M409DRAFT_62921 [Zasmidium cellare ATCC 36951]|uniref:NAD-dependent epimerase/dehydratase domain-containing protein n=1 Tax=Zasmidium cellare ATCC 36951 TaxID=1080233 RepID=A0A6A6CZF5_ZASCE|nr:uncharacterized protein M409DRAFT_62921 [Zasmidium cellare ATCC 36951]KAF2172123.1 hypothetical protein M409DRAFT_62921 [Zasmidium cellare ATCC 36951]
MVGQSNSYNTLPKGSTILVTGANGLIGSHCANQALQHGYKVRGTTRSLEKNKWLVETFEKKYGKDAFELVEVKDMQHAGAFDKAVEGCSAVIHVATVITFDPDPENVIPPTLAGTREILKSAAKTPSVKRVVYTSSSGALQTTTDKPITVTQDTWNDEAVRLVQDPTLFATLPDPVKSVTTYCASKTLAEKACFEFVEQEKPHFVLNTVAPNMNIGPTIHPTQPASSSAMNYIDVRDDGRLHLAAAIFDDVQGERIWGMAGDYNFNDIIDEFAKKDPKWRDHERFEDKRDLTVYDRSRSIELLRRLGQDGFVSLADSIRDNIAGEYPHPCAGEIC